ncbi:serine/threonine-protein kinase pakB [Diachasma alloeum]|uniref:serine/threonine-protein kinase pakB n=1 Tax=Diachasma alloeum TaxID=454923 RepID=UPI00073828B2|nr:serine/threonine-protein kinase pakB [Diachasma alloeum]
MLQVLLVLVLVNGLCGLPLSPESGRTTPRNVEEPVSISLELLPPKEDAETANFNDDFNVDILKENVTLATELLPPKEDEQAPRGIVFIVNLFAVKNETDGEDPEETLNDDIKNKVPAILEPVATILLVVEEEDEGVPVSLDELAKELEEEGVKVEKIGDDIETKVIRVDFDGEVSGEDPDVEALQPKKLNRVRRSPHLISNLLQKKFGGGGGCNTCQQPPPPPPCGGGCGGGQSSYVQVIPVYEQPRPYYPPQPHYQPQPQYQPQPHYHQGGGQCDVCNGRGGGGNHGSYSQASAQSSSSSW